MGLQQVVITLTIMYTHIILREAMQVANFIRKTGKRQTTRFAGHLEIGPHLKIACKIFTKVRVPCIVKV